MQARTCLFLLAVSILSLQGGDPLSARPVPRALPRLGQAGTPSTLPQRMSPGATALLFADGSVSCTGADDTSLPVGSVTLSPRGGGMAFRVQLGLGPSMASWPYLVELSLGGACKRPLRYTFALDGGGSGVFTGFYPTTAGPQRVLVDVVSAAPTAPPDPMLREIAPSALMQVVVPDDGTTLLDLAFDGASGFLPWSEQGFTFDGNGAVPGQQLSMVSYGDFPCPHPIVTLTRSSSGTFDALALSVDFSYAEDGYAVVSSDLGGDQELTGGPTVLEGPGWESISTLRIDVYGVGPCGSPAAWLEADDFLVRVH